MLRSFGEPPVFATVSGRWPPAVVGLHGWGRDRDDLAAVLDGLDAVAVDLPGFGLSPAPPQAWGTERYAAALDPLLDAIGQPVVLVGHSFGGRVAVRIARARPEQVRSLVLTGAPIAPRPGPTRRPALPYRLIRAASRRGLVPDTMLERARQRYGSRDYVAAQGVMRAVLVTVLAEDYTADVAALTQPVSLVWGDADAEVPVAVAERARDLLTDADLEVVPGVGHDLPWTRPGPLRAALDARLAR